MESNIDIKNVEDIRFKCLKEASILCQHLNAYDGTYTFTDKDVLRMAYEFTKFVIGGELNGTI